jgi:hypothetical protein
MPGDPKTIRTSDTNTIEAVRRRDGRCLMGPVLRNGCVEGFDVHHIQSKGSGGGDVEGNMICLCRRHHQDAHNHRIIREQLSSTLVRFYPNLFKELA